MYDLRTIEGMLVVFVRGGEREVLEVLGFFAFLCPAKLGGEWTRDAFDFFEAVFVGELLASEASGGELISLLGDILGDEDACGKGRVDVWRVGGFRRGG